MRNATLIAIGLSAAACGPSTDPISGAQVRMDLSVNSAFFAAPFPSAHRMMADGTVRVSSFPNTIRNEYVTGLTEVVAEDVRGFGLTSGVYLPFTESVETMATPSIFESIEVSAKVFLISESGERAPVVVRYMPDGGPYGAEHLLSLQPVQGRPLRPNTRYAAVVLRDARSDVPLGVSGTMRSIVADQRPEAVAEDVFAAYRSMVERLDELGIEPDSIAGLAVFETGDPTAGLIAYARHALAQPAPRISAFELVEVQDMFCVFGADARVPDYQTGELPYTEGGGWAGTADAPGPSRLADARVVVTVPRGAASGPHPVVNFIRTGGGGDRPLVDRGVRVEPGGPAIQPATGPALELARAGFAGISIDGPHGGPRNVTNGDEQFLMFNFLNPVALRDNVRQSALEVVLAGAMIPTLSITSTGCPGLSLPVTFDEDTMVLMGHSMGATIAPLAFAIDDRYRALILSGAGGSWIENIMFKRSPLNVRPIAESVVGYTDLQLELTSHDPVLSLVQWAGEAADPPVYGQMIRDSGRPVLMFQGIEDTYIPPPVANATSLALGLDLAGPALEPSLEPLLALTGRRRLPYPALVEGAGVVVQHHEDPVEDGHEVVFQTEPPKHQYRCFLESLRADATPVVVEGMAAAADCP